MGFVKTPQELLQMGQREIVFYDAEFVFAFWFTHPEIVERLLPPPLKPALFPLATAFIANYPSTSFGPPYQEGALFLLAQYNEVMGNYCLAMPVTNDLAMAGGREYFGFPKKIAQHIHIDHAGEVIQGYVERNGVRFFELEFKPGDQAVDETFRATIEQGFIQQEAGIPTYLFKHFLAPELQGFDYPPRLVRQNTVFQMKTLEWGQADVKLFPSDCDPWYEVEVVQPMGAIRTVGTNTMLPGEVLAEVDPLAFMPYAFTKWD